MRLLKFVILIISPFIYGCRAVPPPQDAVYHTEMYIESEFRDILGYGQPYTPQTLK